jgi:hypothetical protein
VELARGHVVDPLEHRHLSSPTGLGRTVRTITLPERIVSQHTRFSRPIQRGSTVFVDRMSPDDSGIRPRARPGYFNPSGIH